MADLFSFLDNVADEPIDESVIESSAMLVDTPESSAKKRKAEVSQNRGPGVEEEPAVKKPRLDAPNPIVLDDFETEAKREVAASAGLQGSVEAGRLELRHQVRSVPLYFSHL